jgi:GNAT superfamily N-acetyltransferase
VAVASRAELQIRPARREDVPAIARLLADDVLGKTREAADAQTMERYYAAFDAIDRDSRNDLMIAILRQQVVGTYQVTYIPYMSRGGNERCLIEAVRVAPNLRGKGIGQAMMQHALKEAKQRGCLMAQLTTDKRREDAHRFYRALGFVASHEGMKLYL